MRVTIIPSDKWIRKDNLSAHLSEWNFDDSDIHAIQWYDTEGEIEYNGRPPRNEVITDESILQPYVDALDEYLILVELEKTKQSQEVIPLPLEIDPDAIINDQVSENL